MVSHRRGNNTGSRQTCIGSAENSEQYESDDLSVDMQEKQADEPETVILSAGISMSKNSNELENAEEENEHETIDKSLQAEIKEAFGPAVDMRVIFGTIPKHDKPSTGMKL